MATEDLVPQDLPQGGRQQVESGLRLANLPTDSESAIAGPTTPAPQGAPTPGVPAARQQLAGFDVFAGREPNPVPPPSGKEVVDAQVRASANEVLQEVFSRMAGYREP